MAARKTQQTKAEYDRKRRGSYNSISQMPKSGAEYTTHSAGYKGDRGSSVKGTPKGEKARGRIMSARGTDSSGRYTNWTSDALVSPKVVKGGTKKSTNTGSQKLQKKSKSGGTSMGAKKK